MTRKKSTSEVTYYFSNSLSIGVGVLISPLILCLGVRDEKAASDLVTTESLVTAGSSHYS